jgi:SPX domain protein involved in polyphosphate accumulation
MSKKMFESIQVLAQNIQNHFSSSELAVDEDSRIELKYRLTYFQYLKVRNAIKPYVVMDPYTRGTSTNRYLVRSLYFDTPDYRAYEQKMSGDCDRVKFRLRSYSKENTETNTIRVELKMRQGNRMVKKSVFVPPQEYQHFMKHGHWEDIQEPVTTEFERQSLTQGLVPVVLIEYDREGYQTRFKSDLRLTFDHQMRSAHARMLFPDHPFFRTQIPKSVIFEIKFKEHLPLWLTGLVREQGLKVISNSKYTQSLQIARNDLYHPEKVILVR